MVKRFRHLKGAAVADGAERGVPPMKINTYFKIHVKYDNMHFMVNLHLLYEFQTLFKNL